MAAQRDDCERSHIIFHSPVGSNPSPVRVQHRRQSAAVDGNDDDDETVRTEGYEGADPPPSPFADTSPIRRNRQQAGDQPDDGQPSGDQVQQTWQQYGPWQSGYGSQNQTSNQLDYEFEKSVARSAVRMVDLPSSIFDTVQANCLQGFSKLRNALANTDSRLWTKNFIKDMPDGFFTPFEVQAFLASPPGDSWKAIKKACMLRFKSADAPATARIDLLKVALDLKMGVVPYLIELRQQAIISASVIGNDVQPSTVIRKVLADLPPEIASRMLEATDESTRWLNAANCDFRDLSWFDTLSSEIITVHDTLKSAGVKLSPRSGQTYMLNAMQSDGTDSSEAVPPEINAAAVRTFEAAVAAGFSSKDPRLFALAKAAGWRGPSGAKKKRSADDSKGKKKGRKERRKDGDDKFTGDAEALIADCEKAYTAAEWKERLALIQAGKALNVDGDPHKDLFVNDKAKDKNGKKRWVCVKCLRFGHTAPFCDDLKRATSWQQGK